MNKTVLLFVLIFLSIVSYAQQKYTYTITFANIDQFDVKKAVSLLDPLFESSALIGDNLNIFIYESNSDVPKSKVVAELKGVDLKIKSFKREENE
jgi:hypothetical protein